MIEPIVTESVVTFVAVFGIICFCCSMLFWKLWKDSKHESTFWKEKHDTTLSQKKSSEVRLGKTAENMAPFIKDWPYDAEKFRFIGCPVDGISFNEDSIVFVEIKTGAARLTKSQKHAKQLIKDGKVYFETFRISRDGVSLHREDFNGCNGENKK